MSQTSQTSKASQPPQPARIRGPVRQESDSMGGMEVPGEALYGASTQRAVLNFPVSGYRFGRELIRALGLIKSAAAAVNRELGKLDAERAGLILTAGNEVAEGQWDAHFPVDIFQTGSGTSTNMNVNEVIANRCSQLAGLALGSKQPVHPNDHVNMGQSSNDVFPSAIHIAVGEMLCNGLLPALEQLQFCMETKSADFWDLLKIGRTHLMDATPIRLGQEFSGYASQIDHSRKRLSNALSTIEELPLGGTAVGTGINTHPDFAEKVIARISAQTGMLFREADNHFEAQGSRDCLVEVSGQLKAVAIALFKIANDLRWLASGPRCGLGEIRLPEIQPGSSIMPGKVNPVLCEMLMQVCAQVIGNDAAITWGGANGNFELNAMMPMMAHNLMESIRVLTNAVGLFSRNCVQGLEANKERCAELVEHSMAMITSLVPLIGYDLAAQIARESAHTGETIREICRRKEILPEAELEKVLNPLRMTRPF